jgi:choline kinase
VNAAIILAAGRGERLGRYTRHLPKALVRIGGKSLLDWHLAALAAAGIGPVVIVGGHFAGKLRRPGIELVVAADWRAQGPLASLRAARPARFATPFLVLYGDSLHHPANLRRVIVREADIAVAGDRDWRALWDARHEDPLLDAETYRHDEGQLVEIGRRAARYEDIEAQFAGVVRFSPQGWSAVERQLDAAHSPPHDMTGLLDLLLTAGVPVAYVEIRARWCEVDSAADLRLYRRRIREGTHWPHDWRWNAERRACA